MNTSPQNDFPLLFFGGLLKQVFDKTRPHHFFGFLNKSRSKSARFPQHNAKVNKEGDRIL